MFSSQYDQMHYMTAIGEMLCVVTHLKATHPNLAYKVRDTVIRALRARDFKQLPRVVEGLVEKFKTDP